MHSEVSAVTKSITAEDQGGINAEARSEFQFKAPSNVGVIALGISMHSRTKRGLIELRQRKPGLPR